jgi:hypothetical protein
LDEIDESLELGFIELSGGFPEMRGDRLFQGATEEDIKHPAKGPRSGSLSRSTGAVDVGPTILLVHQVPFFLQDTKESSDSGFTWGVWKMRDNLSGRGLPQGIDDIKNLPFTATELGFVAAWHRHHSRGDSGLRLKY